MPAFRGRSASPPRQDSSPRPPPSKPGASREAERAGRSKVDLLALVAVLAAIVMLVALHTSADQIVALMSAAGVLYTAWRTSK